LILSVEVSGAYTTTSSDGLGDLRSDRRLAVGYRGPCMLSEPVRMRDLGGLPYPYAKSYYPSWCGAVTAAGNSGELMTNYARCNPEADPFTIPHTFAFSRDRAVGRGHGLPLRARVRNGEQIGTEAHPYGAGCGRRYSSTYQDNKIGGPP
jgi:hypothetical protein